MWRQVDLGAFPGNGLTDDCLLRCIRRDCHGASVLEALDISGAHAISWPVILQVVRSCPSLRSLTMLCAGPAPLTGPALHELRATRLEAIGSRTRTCPPLRLAASFDVAHADAFIAMLGGRDATLLIDGIDLSWRMGALMGNGSPPHYALQLEAFDSALATSLRQADGIETPHLRIFDATGAGFAATHAGGVDAHGWAIDALCRTLLRASGSLTAVSLASCLLDGRGAAAVANALRHAPALAVLSLADNKMGMLLSASGRASTSCHEGIVCLGQALSSLRRLQCVNLRGCGLVPQQVLHLAHVLPPTLRVLSVAFNHVDNTACSALGILATQGLTSLDAAHTMRWAGTSNAHLCCTALASFLSNAACTLEALYLASNGIDAAALTTLCAGLRSNTSITELDVAMNACAGSDGANPAGLQALRKALVGGNTTLKRLRLCGNPVDGHICLEAALALGKALKVKRSEP